MITVVASFVIIKEVIKPVKKYEDMRIRKFQPTWKKEFPCVKIDADKNEMFCIVCRKYPTVANKASRLYGGSSITGFHRHGFSCESREEPFLLLLFSTS